MAFIKKVPVPFSCVHWQTEGGGVADQNDKVVLNFADWIIPLDDVPAAPQFVPDENPPVVEGPTPDLLQFPTDLEAYPVEGHHPRLMRFGRVA
jgi:hypothetical protein